jgi:peptide-methionine (S)-S-oxide reductase
MRRLAMMLSFTLAIAGLGWYAASLTDGQGRAMAASDSGEAAAATDETVKESENMEKAMFGAGCFWGVEAAFRQIEGVSATAVGYAGGTMENPTYQDVCSGTTGHAEVVQVTYDPGRVSYERLLEVFWSEHDPTQVNRQGPDIGEQYRSVVFYLNDDQRETAEMSKKALDESGRYARPIATSIEAASTFYRAEEYHQRYLEKRGLSSCRIK